MNKIKDRTISLILILILYAIFGLTYSYIVRQRLDRSLEVEKRSRVTLNNNWELISGLHTQ